MRTPNSLSLGRRLVFSVVATLVVLSALELLFYGWGRWTLAQWKSAGTLGDLDEAGSEPIVLWAFGDSYTLGVGAADPSTESYPAVAAVALERKLGRPVRLRNEALPGLNSTEIVDRFERAVSEVVAQGSGEESLPDWVVVLAGINNSRWLGQSGQFCLEEGRGRRPVMNLIARSRVYRVVRHAVLAGRSPRSEDLACRAVAAGFQHLDEGLPDRAQAVFEEALALQPSSTWAALGLGLAHLRVGRHRDAVQYLDLAEQNGLSPPALVLARGFSLRAAGEVERAKEAVKRSLKSDLRPFARLLEAWLLWDEGRPSDAIKIFDRLAGLGEVDESERMGTVVPYALDGRGWSLFALGRLGEAKEAFEAANEQGRLIHIAPHLLGWSHLGLALVHWTQTGPEQAGDELTAALADSATTATVWALRGWQSWSEGRCPEARSWLERSREMVPGLALARPTAAPCEAGLTEVPSEARTLSPPVVTPQVTVSVQDWVDPGDTRLLRADLERAARLSREHGIPMIVLSYPQPDAHPELREAVREVSAALSVPWLDPEPRIQEALDMGRPWEELLIPDGHPTTAGYGLIGEALAEQMLEP